MTTVDVGLPTGWQTVARDVYRPLQVDALGQFSRVRFVDQSPGHAGEFGIAQPVGSVRHGQFHGLRHDMHERGLALVGNSAARAEAFQGVQHLGHANAAGTGRRKTDDGVAAVGRDDRRSLPRLVLPEVLRRQQSAVLGHPLVRGLGEGTCVKPGGPMVGDRTIAACQIGLHQVLAFLIGFMIGFQEDLTGTVEAIEAVGAIAQVLRRDAIDGKALLGHSGSGTQATEPAIGCLPVPAPVDRSHAPGTPLARAPV